MKTRVLLLACAVALISAQNVSGENLTTTSTYYGTKASQGANNPCKGATTRICGEIKLTYTLVSNSSFSKVYDTEKVVIDADGIVLNKTYNQISVPLNLTLQEFIIKDMEYGTLSNLTFDREP